MQLEHAFTVPVGIDEAWAVLLDIERVAPCMPGAAVDSVDGDDFTGTVKVKLGPIGLTYKGKASFVEKDEAAHKAVIRAQGRDARGNGTAAATVTAVLVAEGDTTKVAVTTDLDITGKPAQFGRGVMVDVGNKLIGQFADCLAGQLTEGDGRHAAAEAPTAELPTASPTATTDELPAATAKQPDAPASADAPAKQADAPANQSGAAASADASAKPPGAAASADAPAKKAPVKKAAAKKAPAKKAPAKQVAAASTGTSTTSAAVNGSAPAAESAAAQEAPPPAPEESAPAQEASPAPVRPAPREVEPIDLMASAGPAVAKRLAPVIGGLLLLIILLRLLRRSR